MKTRQPLAILLILAGVMLAGLGALTADQAATLWADMENRAMRELVNRDLLAGISPTAAAYFQGRAEGYAEAAALLHRMHETGTTDAANPQP